MGVMSRRVVPACTNLCIFCPALRSRSRLPVKRYKKLLADIFPRSQNAEPNDRKIGKLCDYAAKNPLRIPKITEYLEQKFYKDLRNEQFTSVKIVLLIYRKLLSTCKEQMPLFASSLLGIVRTLLEQSRQDDLQILGCHTLVDFINSQADSTYMFNLEGLISNLCQLAQEVGDDERVLCLRSAGLMVLAFMVQFMVDQSHISMDLDNIISVTLENCTDLAVKPENSKNDDCVSQVNDVSHGSLTPDVSKKVSSRSAKLVPTTYAYESPSYWAKVCLQNMAQLAKDATTVRRVLEPLFRCFDIENHWLPEKGLAFSVLTYLQLVLEETGDNSHLLLSILVKHLDHKDVAKQLVLQLNIVNVVTQLALNVKQQVSVAIVGAIADLVKHLRKSIQNSADSSTPRVSFGKPNTELQYALENCISQLSMKVGDVGPILDTIAVVLENVPANSIVAKATIFAVYRTVLVVSGVPNVSYFNKAFPDALFHHLLLAMSHPDNEARVGAHRIFSTVLLQSGSFCIQAGRKNETEGYDGGTWVMGKITWEQHANQFLKCLSRGQSHIINNDLADGKMGLTSLRLSSHQVNLLLSSIWIQATSMDNNSETFEAMALTYALAVLFTLLKSSSHISLLRCFQLAFSLRSVSLDQEGGLQLSRRKSLFTLASYMLIFSARASNLSELVSIVKSSLTEDTVDPCLELVEDTRLQAICIQPGGEHKLCGVQEAELSVIKFLSAVKSVDQQMKDVLLIHLKTKFQKMSEAEISSMKKQLFQKFLPNDDFPSGAPLFMETPQPCSPLAQTEFQAFDEIIPLITLTEEDAVPDPYGSQSDRKASLSIHSPDILSVNQLLDSVLETARHVASLPNSSRPAPYDEVMTQCEALVTGKQKKMSVLQSFKLQREAKARSVFTDDEKIGSFSSKETMELSEVEMKLLSDIDQNQVNDPVFICSKETNQQQSFRLPPSSPYDKFLKAAGC